MSYFPSQKALKCNQSIMKRLKFSWIKFRFVISTVNCLVICQRLKFLDFNVCN